MGVAREDAGGGTTYNYVKDSTGNLVARLSSAGARHYYLVDGLGSIVKLIDTNGAVTNKYSYDPGGS